MCFKVASRVSQGYILTVVIGETLQCKFIGLAMSCVHWCLTKEVRVCFKVASRVSQGYTHSCNW